MKLLISLFIAIFILSGCGSQKRVVVKSKELPNWYVNPVKTTKATLYAVGEGENKNEAVVNALNAMVSTLSVSISSEFNTRSIVTEGLVESYRSVSTNEVKARVERFRISNYEIINSKEFGFERYLVAIKSDKLQLFNSLNQELNQKFKIIENKNIEVKNYNSIKQLRTHKDAKESTFDVEHKLLIMNSLNPNFSGNNYIKKLQEIDSRYENLLSKISFNIDSNSDARNFETAIVNGLSFKKYNIKNSIGQNHFNIFISSKSTKASAYGFDLLRSAIFITVQDNSGTIIGSNKISITGQSTQGYIVAKENVAIKLGEMIKIDGIDKIIGLEI